MRKTQFRLFVAGMALISLILTGVVLANGGYAIPWHVIGGGGGTSSGGYYTLDSTIGQPVAATSGGGAYQACAGYWCGNVPGWHMYIPTLLKAQGSD